MHRPLRYLIALFLSAVLLPANAEEKIQRYHSEIDIAVDATMTVTETIDVVAEGNRIRRGIYRDFPTRYTDRYGNQYVVGFDVLEVTRDGNPEPWHTERRSNGVRVYAGSSDHYLSPGQYSYSFKYTTNRQLGFFEDHDELYWNVTGNGWAFPIEKSSATVNLPGAVSERDITLGGYTGAQGSTEKAYTASIKESEGTISADRNLAPAEGLTLVLTWPKGVVEAPGFWQLMRYMLADNFGLLVALTALLGSSGYLLLMWHRYGRDPAPGVIFPHYEPPPGYSPASSRYIMKMGYDSKVLTAAVINLAVKGYLSITDEDNEYTLKRLPSREPLAAGEEKLLNRLFRSGSTLLLDNENHMLISGAKTAHTDALQKDYLNIYFRTNGKKLLPSFLGSLLALGLILVTGSFVPLVIAIVILIAVLHILFLFLMKAPQGRGRLLMDKLQGFKLYLEVAEKDDLNLRHPPELTPELFEKYLPFAIALGVEQAWAEQFSKVFAAMTASGQQAYRPVWYSGHFHHNSINTFASNVSGNLSSAISSAGTAPGSSSGSGGSSGGGGGGGGGGGW